MSKFQQQYNEMQKELDQLLDEYRETGDRAISDKILGLQDSMEMLVIDELEKECSKFDF